MSQTQSEVAAASKRWIEHFNAGRTDDCVAAYAPEAIMVAAPKGRFVGTDQIRAFWAPFLESGAGALRYSNVRIDVEAENRAVLSADWTMNVGRGVITKELWVRSDDGTWLLEEDHFEIQETFDDPG